MECWKVFVPIQPVFFVHVQPSIHVQSRVTPISQTTTTKKKTFRYYAYNHSAKQIQPITTFTPSVIDLTQTQSCLVNSVALITFRSSIKSIDTNKNQVERTD